MPFPALEILLEFEEADQRIRGFVLLTQKHLLCMKASRKCLLTSCYFCVTVTFGGWVCVKRSVPQFLPGGTGPRVSFISEGFKVLWRHLPIFVTSRWIFSINQSPRICFTQSFDLNSSAGQPSCVSHGSAAAPGLHMGFAVPTLAARLSKVLHCRAVLTILTAPWLIKDFQCQCPSSFHLCFGRKLSQLYHCCFESICSSWWLWRQQIKQNSVVISRSCQLRDQLSFVFPCCQEDKKYAQLQ